MMTGLPAATSCSMSAKRGASWYETRPWRRVAASISICRLPLRSGK